MSASGQHTYYLFSWCVAFVACSFLHVHSEADHLMKEGVIVCRRIYSTCNCLGFSREVLHSQLKEEIQVTTISFLRTTGASSPSLAPNRKNDMTMEVISIQQHLLYSQWEAPTCSSALCRLPQTPLYKVLRCLDTHAVGA